MATYDLTVAPYRQSNLASGIETNTAWNYRKFVMSELQTLKDGTVPSNANTFKIFKCPKGILIPRVKLIVVLACGAYTCSIGYTDGTNGAADTFLAATSINSAGVTAGTADLIYMPNSGSSYTKDAFITITINDVDALTAAGEIIIGVESMLIQEQVNTALTTPV